MKALKLLNDYTGPTTGQALPFTNVEELAELKTTNLGCVRGGATNAFFARSDNPTYKRIFERMQSTDNSFVLSNIEGKSISKIIFIRKYNFLYMVTGIERVKNEDFAFFMESATLEYALERDCDLLQVGGLLNSKGYVVK